MADIVSDLFSLDTVKAGIYMAAAKYLVDLIDVRHSVLKMLPVSLVVGSYNLAAPVSAFAEAVVLFVGFEVISSFQLLDKVL